MKTTLALFFGLIVTATTQLPAADALTEALQKGLFEEEANQNLEAAIKAYQDVLTRAEEQRRVAATALFRLAECYRKQGKTNEATAEYRRLLRDYTDQSTLVNLSRQNLVGLGVTTTVASATPPKSGDALTTDEEQREIQRLRALVKNSPDLINAGNRVLLGSGAGTLLHGAALKGHLLVAEYLLANGADINALDSSHATPLYHAARNGHKRMVELLLAKGAQPSPARAGQPLHAAVEGGFKAVVEVLLAHKADVNATQPTDARLLTPFLHAGMTALHIAIKEEFLHIAELLLANGANLDSVVSAPWPQRAGALHQLERLDGTPLHFAIQSGNVTAAQLLLAKQADVNARTTDAGLAPLHYVSNPRLLPDVARSLTEMLLEAGGKIDATGTEGSQLAGWTPLHLAVYHKLAQLAQLLLENGADPNLPLSAQSGNEGTALNMAVRAGTSEIVELLLKHKANVNAGGYNGYTPLLRATIERNRQLAELLLSHKADVSAIDNDGNSALAFAVQNGDVPLAELLLSKGANPNGTNNTGYPLLHVAIATRPSLPIQQSPAAGGARPVSNALASPSQSSNPMVDLLIAYKADPNIRDREGQTALFRAVADKQWPLMEVLIARKADVNARTRHGYTPLHRAAQGDEKAVRLLLEHSANPNATNDYGQTPLWASINHTNIIALLVKNGADINHCDNDGDTFLHEMLKRRNSNAAEHIAYNQLLLELGADVLRSCSGGPSPFEYVLGFKGGSILSLQYAELLRKYHPKELARVDLEGAVKRLFWYFESSGKPKLSEVIAAVGLTDKADPHKIEVVRDDPATGFKRRTQHNMVLIRQRYLSGGQQPSSIEDVVLREGDRIIVPAH